MNTKQVKQYQSQLKELFENINIYDINNIEELEEKVKTYLITLHDISIGGNNVTCLWYLDIDNVNSGILNTDNFKWYNQSSNEYKQFITQFES